MRELLCSAELPSGVKPWHSALAGSLGWAGSDRPLELLPCNLSHQDQHITEEEMHRETSKDKVTVSASSKGRNRNNTPFCHNSIIILINFILWVTLELLGKKLWCLIDSNYGIKRGDDMEQRLQKNTRKSQVLTMSERGAWATDRTS